MRRRPVRGERVLGVDPTTRGCSFAVLEGRRRLIDWGNKRAPGRNKNVETLSAVVELIRLCDPHLLALEDCRAAGSRRCARVQTLIHELGTTGKDLHLRVVLVAPQTWRAACAGTPGATKHDVAVALAGRYPELERRLPPKRKAWMTEDPRMGVFDAVALAVTALGAHHAKGRRSSARGDP